MKLSLTGMLVELDKITFKVGGYLTVTIEFDGEIAPITERVRSIKHYDKYYRTAPKKKLVPGETPPPPKKLAEFHFHMLSERAKTIITKHHIRQNEEPKTKKKK